MNKINFNCLNPHTKDRTIEKIILQSFCRIAAEAWKAELWAWGNTIQSKSFAKCGIITGLFTRSIITEK